VAPPDQPPFSHVRDDGRPSMVDVGGKAVTRRRAVAKALVELDADAATLLRDGALRSKKGPVFETAIVAGTLAAKRTPELIPFCHSLPLDDCQLHLELNAQQQVEITCEAACSGRTGVEMEALTGATVAALTVYDMCKSASRHIVIREARVIAKEGGRHDFDLRT